ncbi:hypothetical protein A5630_29860 [Mycolicibacterium mucogenicum]|uniref:Uncharacterized protein n=1 Tax=Mycolicibacterium mucogenicum TaxID=56689 RepID=A0A1A3GSE8_MYCMU|nr:hypothetical protein A5630_29860 [Mycolicibacterium mucogenicum]
MVVGEPAIADDAALEAELAAELAADDPALAPELAADVALDPISLACEQAIKAALLTAAMPMVAAVRRKSCSVFTRTSFPV